MLILWSSDSDAWCLKHYQTLTVPILRLPFVLHFGRDSLEFQPFSMIKKCRCHVFYHSCCTHCLSFSVIFAKLQRSKSSVQLGIDSAEWAGARPPVVWLWVKGLVRTHCCSHHIPKITRIGTSVEIFIIVWLVGIGLSIDPSKSTSSTQTIIQPMNHDRMTALEQRAYEPHGDQHACQALNESKPVVLGGSTLGSQGMDLGPSSTIPRYLLVWMVEESPFSRLFTIIHDWWLELRLWVNQPTITNIGKICLKPPTSILDVLKWQKPWCFNTWWVEASNNKCLAWDCPIQWILGV